MTTACSTLPKLPSGPELATQLGVARTTVQQAIRLLRSEGLVVSRQGRGVFLRERTQRSVELRPHIEQAFESEQVSLDFARFSAETLHGVWFDSVWSQLSWKAADRDQA
ncbi:MAG TPA: GntR family transcriptional regulator [Microlunatus sp.]|nr:GntR family transcriptional regulator [Microlunatus sp.]